jgi:hypothetical protein
MGKWNDEKRLHFLDILYCFQVNNGHRYKKERVLYRTSVSFYHVTEIWTTVLEEGVAIIDYIFDNMRQENRKRERERKRIMKRMNDSGSWESRKLPHHSSVHQNTLQRNGASGRLCLWTHEDRKQQANKQTLWPLVRKRTIPSERPPPVDDIFLWNVGSDKTDMM